MVPIPTADEAWYWLKHALHMQWLTFHNIYACLFYSGRCSSLIVHILCLRRYLQGLYPYPHFITLSLLLHHYHLSPQGSADIKLYVSGAD